MSKSIPRLIAVLPAISALVLSAAAQTTAIVGATVIDGNGGKPIETATVVIQGKRITAVGPMSKVRVPDGATVIDGKGKFVTPGFIDTNVHMSLYGWKEELLWHEPHFNDIAIEGVQLNLKYGITTIRDSYGALLPLLHARDAINSGKVIGPRLLVAGNIVGWGGPFSRSFSNMTPESFFQEQMNDWFAQGVGDELVHMTPEEVRTAINTYLDKGPDFIKYAGTSHDHSDSWIVFSPRVQTVIVEETHKRGRVAETHSTSPEGLRLSVLAGIDLIQHPEVHMVELPDELIKLIVDRKVICSILSNQYAGETWEAEKKKQKAADSARADSVRKGDTLVKARTTSWERRNKLFNNHSMLRFKNAQKLIKGGCIVSVSTDAFLPGSPKFSRTVSTKPHNYSPGYGTLLAIEGLVELGMTPMQALVAATKHGAMATKGIKEYGTIEAGKLADLLILDADPVADIKNIHKLNLVMKEGMVIDRDKLPTNPILTKKDSSAK